MGQKWRSRFVFRQPLSGPGHQPGNRGHPHLTPPQIRRRPVLFRLFTKADSDIEELEDLRGQMVAFEESFSTSGYMLPLAFLIENGMNPTRKSSLETAVSADEVGYVFSTADNTTIQWVISGKASVGVIDDVTFGRLPAETQAELKIIARTEAVPRQLVLIGPTISPELQAAIKATLLAADEDEAGRIALEIFLTTEFTGIPRRRGKSVRTHEQPVPTGSNQQMKQAVWKNWSLALKLTITITFIVVLVVAVVTLVSIRRERQTFRAELEQQAILLIDTIAASAADSLYFLDADFLNDMMVDLGRNEVVVFGRIYDEDGRIVADALDPDQRFNVRPDSFGKAIITSGDTLFDWRADELIAGRSVMLGAQTVGGGQCGPPHPALSRQNPSGARPGRGGGVGRRFTGPGFGAAVQPLHHRSAARHGESDAARQRRGLVAAGRDSQR
ncbi:MAG: phosphate/phosphite/phosphonate ABC transporter substrate-binding protein [Chloroflexi bacterium]|nr:phosphate/phosphite/phosphonate ABC transporter substrate-binding protein [Chloroflexota bacterium]